MCGRFSLTLSDICLLCKRYDAEKKAFSWHARFNIAPTQKHPVVLFDGKNKLIEPMGWGLIPHWAKEKKFQYSMVNARGETVDQKPAFKGPFRSRRCLVPTDGFYEWQKKEGEKQPLRIKVLNPSIFSLAGLWEEWTDPRSNETHRTFTIITTEANSLLENIHDRMPVILHQRDEAKWLDPGQSNDALKKLLVPFPSEEMEFFPVSTIVNSWKNDVPECIEKS